LGDSHRVRRLLHEDSELVGAWSPDGFAALHLAAFFGRAGTARLLIERGADVEAVSRNRMTVRPLHSAVPGQDQRTVEVLLDAGADPNAPSHAGFTPLLDAAQNGDGDIVELLLRRGADATASLDNGRTAVDLASAGGHDEMACLLASRGG
jgi:ankyrin repeat protein